MKLITLNCNGIRSAKSKGLFEYIKKRKARHTSVSRNQSRKESQMNPEFLKSLGYTSFVHSAQKRKDTAELLSLQKKTKVI